PGGARACAVEAAAPPARPEPAAREGEAWLPAARSGTAWALERFYHAYQQPIYSLCRRLLARPEDAEDATQATFVRAFRELPRCRGESSVKTWIYRIAVNEALQMIRRRREQPCDLEWRAEGGDSAADVERLAVHAALARTRPDYRAILVLQFWEELSYNAIAA